jgi:DNA-binding NarL/FixJ family response regulator
MDAPGGSSQTASTNGNGRSSSASTPTIPTELHWQAFSERGQAILRLIAIPISNGYSEREIARELGTTRRWVFDRLAELRDEVERLELPR